MINLALIGAGKWGKNYLNTASNAPDCAIKYVCAQTKRTLDSLPNNYIKVTSPKDLLKYKDIDGIIIASPSATHFSLTKLFLLNGFNLLIEKPLTTNYTEALELYKIWKSKKVKVLVGHIYLYNPAFQKFKEIFESKNNFKYITFEGLKSSVRKDSSVIWDWGPHPISIFLSLIKYPPLRIRAVKNINKIEASLIFPKGFAAKLKISWFGDKKIRKLVAQGKSKKIQFDDTNTNNQKISVYSKKHQIQYPNYSFEPALKVELNEFVQALQNKKNIVSDINMGLNVVKILSAIEKSVDNGGELIKLDE